MSIHCLSKEDKTIITSLHLLKETRPFDRIEKHVPKLLSWPLEKFLLFGYNKLFILTRKNRNYYKKFLNNHEDHYILAQKLDDAFIAATILIFKTFKVNQIVLPDLISFTNEDKLNMKAFSVNACNKLWEVNIYSENMLCTIAQAIKLNIIDKLNIKLQQLLINHLFLILHNSKLNDDYQNNLSSDIFLLVEKFIRSRLKKIKNSKLELKDNKTAKKQLWKILDSLLCVKACFLKNKIFEIIYKDTGYNIFYHDNFNDQLKFLHAQYFMYEIPLNVLESMLQTAPTTFKKERMDAFVYIIMGYIDWRMFDTASLCTEWKDLKRIKEFLKVLFKKKNNPHIRSNWDFPHINDLNSFFNQHNNLIKRGCTPSIIPICTFFVKDLKINSFSTDYNGHNLYTRLLFCGEKKENILNYFANNISDLKKLDDFHYNVLNKCTSYDNLDWEIEIKKIIAASKKKKGNKLYSCTKKKKRTF